MVAVAVAGGPAETENNHVGAVTTNHPNDVGKDRIMAPLGDGLVGGFREAEVDGAREELLRAIDAAGVQQLLRANQPQRRALLRAEHVLAAFPAGHRKIRRAHVASLGEIRQQLAALVVGMGGDGQHRAQFVQLQQRLLDFGRRRGLGFETSGRRQR